GVAILVWRPASPAERHGNKRRETLRLISLSAFPPCLSVSAGKQGPQSYLSGFRIGVFEGSVKRSSFKLRLISTESEYISNSFSPLRNRRMLRGHFTPPPASRYLAKTVSSLSKSLYCSLRRLNSWRTGSLSSALK